MTGERPTTFVAARNLYSKKENNLGNDHIRLQKNTGPLVAGVDLGGTAVNSTLLDSAGTFLISGLCEHPARSVEGPTICLQQIVDGLQEAVTKAGRNREEIAAIGLDTPGPATADGVFSSRGSTNLFILTGLDLIFAVDSKRY